MGQRLGTGDLTGRVRGPAREDVRVLEENGADRLGPSGSGRERGGRERTGEIGGQAGAACQRRRTRELGVLG
jgi:hypothetical protein